MTPSPAAPAKNDSSGLRKEFRIERRDDQFFVSQWDGAQQRWVWDSKASLDEVIQHLKAYLAA